MLDRLILPLATVIMTVWVAAAVFSFLTEQYVPLEIATPAMLIVVGRVFGVQVARNGNGKK